MIEQTTDSQATLAVPDELFADGDRCCYCWTMRWTEADGTPASSTGVDIFTVRGGKVTYKKTYE